jgi:putative transcriptional regulator
MNKKKYPGHLLVANPNNPRDELSRSVIILLSHTDDISIGVQLNKPMPDTTIRKIADNLKMNYSANDPLYNGGNMSSNNIHVIHSPDWQGLSTVLLNDDIAVTSDVSVLAALSRGEGPELFRACAGYWFWGEDRLNKQLDPRWKLEPHKWEVVPSTLENVFQEDGVNQWRCCLDEAVHHQVNTWF